MKQPAAVFIAEEGKDSLGTDERVQKLRHQRELLMIPGRQVARDACVQSEKVQRIQMVVGRLFEVTPIRAHLALHLLLHNLRAQIAPMLLLENYTQRVQRHSLS